MFEEGKRERMKLKKYSIYWNNIRKRKGTKENSSTQFSPPLLSAPVCNRPDFNDVSRSIIISPVAAAAAEEQQRQQQLLPFRKNELIIA